MNMHYQLSGCQPGSVRLAGGPTAREGRIELCVQSSPGVTIWGSVCNPQYYSYSYGSASTYGIAEIVCRQLNYSRTGIKSCTYACIDWLVR